MALYNLKKDPNTSDWIKVDNIVLGDEFPYKSGVNKDIINLLFTLNLDTKVSVCLYKWSTGEYYTKTSYNITNL